MTDVRLGGRRRRFAAPRFPLAMLAALVGIFLLLRTDLLRTGAPDAPAIRGAAAGSPVAPSLVHAVTVHDGDTLTVVGSGGRQRVRIFGIDCPEHGQPFADEARLLAQRLVGGSELRLLPVETDRLGRLVARVEIGDQDLAEELLRAGLAWHFRRYSDDPAYQAAEDRARAERRGLWTATRPTPPWDWRREHPIDRS